MKQTTEPIIDQTSTQMRKGVLTLAVLRLCSGRPMYTADIISSLQSAELLVVEGTLYPLLSRLQKQGLLTYEWQESEQGPPRKYYVASEDGKKALRTLSKSWLSLVASIANLGKEQDE